jgi:hypothetical protein
MVMVLLEKAAETPGGRFVAEPMPVTPVVVWLIACITEFVQTVGVADAADTELLITLIIPEVAVYPGGPEELQGSVVSKKIV